MARSALVYMILGFLPLASSFLLTPIYTKYLSPTEYGLIALAGVLQTYLSLWVCFSLDAAFSRFYFRHYKDKQLTSELLSTSLITILVITIITGVMLFFTGDFLLRHFFDEASFTYTSLGWPVLLTAGTGMCYTVLSIYFRDSENIRMFSIMAVAYFLLLTACTFYGVVILKGGAEGSIMGKMVGSIATMFIFLSVVFYRSGFVFSRKLFREMLKFSSPLMVYALMAAIFDTMDRFFISHYFDLAVLGKYNFAFVIASVIGIVISSYSSAVNPQVYKLFLDKSVDRSEQINELMKRFIWTALVFASLCILLGYFAVKYLINPDYHWSLIFLPILSITFIPRSFYIAWSYPLFIESKTRTLPLINSFSIVTGIVSNLVLIPLIGVKGIAVSLFLIKSAQAAGAFYAIKKLNIYQPRVYDFKDVLPATLFFLVMVTALSCISYESIYYTILIFISFITIALLFIKNNKALLKRLFLKQPVVR